MVVPSLDDSYSGEESLQANKTSKRIENLTLKQQGNFFRLNFFGMRT